MKYKTFPPVPREFLTALEEKFPDQCPPKGTPVDEIYYKQGQVSVLAFLRAQFKQQNLNILEN
jgi:hypothetical protein